MAWAICLLIFFRPFQSVVKVGWYWWYSEPFCKTSASQADVTIIAILFHFQCDHYRFQPSFGSTINNRDGQCAPIHSLFVGVVYDQCSTCFDHKRAKLITKTNIHVQKYTLLEMHLVAIAVKFSRRGLMVLCGGRIFTWCNTRLNHRPCYTWHSLINLVPIDVNSTTNTWPLFFFICARWRMSLMPVNVIGALNRQLQSI